MSRLRRIYWAAVETWGDLHYPGRRMTLRRSLCRCGLHWPIVWSDYAEPGSYDPPEPPEPGYCCEWCGKLRLPYHAWMWRIEGRLWEIRHRVVGVFGKEHTP